MSGGPFSDEADAPEAPNLTPAGDIGQWSEEQFVVTIRTGVTPSGNELDDEFMQWENFREMTDDELKALWLYLTSLPAVEKE